MSKVNKDKKTSITEISQKAKLEYLGGAFEWQRKAANHQAYASLHGKRDEVNKIGKKREKRAGGQLRAQRKFRDAEKAGKTKHESIDLPTEYGGEYSVRKLDGLKLESKKNGKED